MKPVKDEKSTDAVKASETRYRRLFETAQDAILILNGDSGKIVDANPFVIDLLGYTLEELMGKQLWQIGLFPDIEANKAAFDRLRKSGYIRYEDLPLQTKDGRRADVEFVSNAYIVDGRNVIQCNIRDITERVQATRAMRASEVRYRRLFETAQDAILILDGDSGKVIDANPFLIALLGYTREELVGKELWEIGLFRDINESKSAFDRLQRDGYIRYEDLPLETKAGKRAEVEFVSNAYKVDGRNIIQCNIRDITDRKSAEKAAQEGAERQKRTEDDLSRLFKKAESLNQAKDEFLATLSHELRTPMTSILGWTALLAMGSLDEKSRMEGIATIHRSAKLQAQLIDDVLDVSRMITGKLRLTIEPVDMESVLREALAAFVPAAEAKELLLRMDFQPGMLFLGGDPARLQQVFWNLLSNAVKFTPAGGRIDVRLFSRDSNVVVEVQDTGPGIRPEFLPYAFDRFAQQEGGTMRHHGGMGIGLSIAKQLVELHGGTISVASEGDGCGTTFTVSIPVQATMPERRPVSIDARRRAERRSSRVEAPSIAGLRVLIIDDEQDSRRTIAAILEQYGATVTAASSADEGLALTTRESFDVLLCDIAMPEQDGYALIRRIRLPADERSQIPAVALTAYGRPMEREIALGEGFDEYLKKPVEPEELVSLVADMAERNVSRVSM